MRRVIAALKAAGATDVKTQYVSLSPQYNDKSEAQGFVATNTVSATIKELAKAGAVIDAAVNAGANQVYGPSLSTATRTSSTARPSRPRSQTLARMRRCSLPQPTSRSVA